MVAGEELQRDQRRAAAGRALVLEPAPEELGLLPEAKLTYGAVRDGPLLVVGRADRRFELVLPARPQLGELALGALSGQFVRLSGG
jgi:hypothetical protein